MKNRFNFGYFIREGFRSIFSHGLMSFAAVCMIVACLLIMGSFSLVAINAERMLSQAEDENEFLAIIDENYTDTQIRQLQDGKGFDFFYKFYNFLRSHCSYLL